MTNDASAADENEAPSEPPPTVPAYSMTVSGWDEETCRRLADILGAVIQTISRYIDLERLDGITVAADYPAALAALDRGYETKHVLTPTTELAIGIAMTPAVIRDSVIKSHIVFNAVILSPLLEDPQNELWKQALGTVAHECAHVEVTKVFDEAFPGVLLQHRFRDIDESFRWQVINACWDEYAACRIAAAFAAKDTSSNLEETFVEVLNITRDKVNANIRRYRTHRDVERVWAEVVGNFSNLMKFGSYLLGHLHGCGGSLEQAPKAREALAQNWFTPYFERLDTALTGVWADYGKWGDQSAFMPIGEILSDLVANGGLLVHVLPGGKYYVDIPFTPETMPTGVE